MTLKEKLERLKNREEQFTPSDWEAYKKDWQDAVADLQYMIRYKWLHDYETNGLMSFSQVNVKRIDPYIGEYSTSILEITLINSKYLILEPISSITTEFDGKLEFYLSGNMYEKINIIRRIIDGGKHDWIFAKSKDPIFTKFDKESLEKIIDEWL